MTEIDLPRVLLRRTLPYIGLRISAPILDRLYAPSRPDLPAAGNAVSDQPEP